MCQLDDPFQAVRWTDEDKLRLLDQRLLPDVERYIDYERAADVAQAIRNMVVRGAPAIGIAAAYAAVLAASEARQNGEDWKTGLSKQLDMLLASRPTAVNLQWAINQCRDLLVTLDSIPEIPLLALAKSLHQQDINANRCMGSLGITLIKPQSAVLSHCNAGALATGGYGTALGVIRQAYAEHLLKQIYISETRPLRQGARLTLWELNRFSIPATLLVDSAAASLMSQAKIDWLIVGADRITANGDVINKIGTYMHALAARYHKVRVMVVAPVATVDMSLQSGDQVTIEERSPAEVQANTGGEKILNPAFDITPAELIDFIVTEKGVVEYPNLARMKALFNPSVK